jgi:hypothetical protein
VSAQPARHLRVVEVNDETGEAAGIDVEQLVVEVEKLRTDLAMAQRDVKTKNRRISELERDKARERLEHPDRKLIERVCTYWHRRCRAGDARINPMSPARFDAVAGLVEMTEVGIVEVDGKRRRRKKRRYEPEDFKMAIDGAHFDHYVKVRKNGTEQHFDDLELICRDSKQFEEFRARVPSA